MFFYTLCLNTEMPTNLCLFNSNNIYTVYNATKMFPLFSGGFF